MSTFAMTTDGDLDFSTGNLVVVTDPNEEVAIDLQTRLRFFLGEWFADTRIGVPYYERVFVKAPDIPALKRMFNSIIREVEGVSDILQLDFIQDTAERTLQIQLRVLTVDGAVITGAVGRDEPFIVELN